MRHFFLFLQVFPRFFRINENRSSVKGKKPTTLRGCRLRRVSGASLAASSHVGECGKGVQP